MGIRQALGKLLGGRTDEGIVFSEERSENYRRELAEVGGGLNA